MSKKDSLINNGTIRMFWTVSNTAYDLRLADIDIRAALSGHLHLHTNTKAKRLQVFFKSHNGWNDITAQYLLQRHDSASVMIYHPNHSDLFLTYLEDDIYEPRFLKIE